MRNIINFMFIADGFLCVCRQTILETRELVVVYDAGLEQTAQQALAAYSVIKPALEINRFSGGWTFDRPWCCSMIENDSGKWQDMSFVVAYALADEKRWW